MTAAPALDAQLSFAVGDVAPRFHVDARLALDAGVLVLFGPSGAGKTLTLKALAGLVEVDSGHVRTSGETLMDTARGLRVPVHRRRIGYVPQHQTLFPFLDVAGNVAFGLPRSLRRGPRVTGWLEELGIAHLASKRPELLSGGERQRVALARALAVEPRLLLLDEPFASIDEAGRRLLGALVREIVRRHDLPTLLVTHDAAEAEALGDRLVRFERGRTMETGAPSDVLGPARRTVRGTVVSVERVDGGTARARLVDAEVVGPAEQVKEGPLEVHEQGSARERTGVDGA